MGVWFFSDYERWLEMREIQKAVRECTSNVKERVRAM